MHSRDLAQFSKWVRFDTYLGPRFTEDIPCRSGVYVFRLDRSFGRLVGESDILYIGSNARGGTLYDRFMKNYLRGTGGRTTRRIHGYLFNRGYIGKAEVSWIATEDVQLEKDLLEQYEEQHHEIPPWNRIK